MFDPLPGDQTPGSWLLDALTDGVVLVGPGWDLLYVNETAQTLLHMPRDLVVGKVVGVDLPEPPPERMAIYRSVMEGRRPRRLRDVSLATEDGEVRHFDGEVLPSPGGGIALIFRDITERRRTEQAATRLGRILESSWHEIYIFDADSLCFLQVSAGARDNLGYSEEEMLELTPLDLKPEYTLEAFQELIAPLQSGESSQVIFETVHRRKDLSLYPVEVRLQLPPGEGVFIAIILDITDRKHAQEQLESQALELEVLNDELRSQTALLEDALATRNRFYAAMSHELRTPINAVIGYNELILEGIYGPTNPQQRNGIERSQRAARHLLEIVNDVLDISRLEAGKVGIQSEQVRVAELLEDLLVTTQPLAQQYGTECRLELRDCPDSIITDPRRLRQILLNLISNAAKFGAGKPIVVRCSCTDDGGVGVEVEDQGLGIPPGERERVFEEFVQLDASDDAKGTGLGLSISRKLAELLGGRLTVSSASKGGSVFRLELPPTPDSPVRAD